jgi:N-ethylmaleimide reductase
VTEAVRSAGSQLFIQLMHVGRISHPANTPHGRQAVVPSNRGGANLPTRIADIDNGTADVIAVASMSLANPDLVERIKTNAPLNAPDPSTFYGGGTKGYTDYPTLAMTAHQ